MMLVIVSLSGPGDLDDEVQIPHDVDDRAVLRRVSIMDQKGGRSFDLGTVDVIGLEGDRQPVVLLRLLFGAVDPAQDAADQRILDETVPFSSVEILISGQGARRRSGPVSGTVVFASPEGRRSPARPSR